VTGFPVPEAVVPVPEAVFPVPEAVFPVPEAGPTVSGAVGPREWSAVTPATNPRRTARP
jgi:hypothetical protein